MSRKLDHRPAVQCARARPFSKPWDQFGSAMRV
jgi:hypothetical protein